MEHLKKLEEASHQATFEGVVFTAHFKIMYVQFRYQSPKFENWF